MLAPATYTASGALSRNRITRKTVYNAFNTLDSATTGVVVPSLPENMNLTLRNLNVTCSSVDRAGNMIYKPTKARAARCVAPPFVVHSLACLFRSTR